MNTNKKSGWTLIETLVIIAIVFILAGMIIPSIYRAKKKEAEQINHQKEINKTIPQIEVGNFVYVNGMSITGRVNSISRLSPFVDPIVDVLVQGTNGIPVILEKINIRLLNVIPVVENWR